MIHPGDAELNDLLDSSGETGSRTAAHLAACEDCRLRFERLRQLDRTLRNLPPDRAPARFTARTMERLRRSTVPSFAWSVLRNVAPLLALAFVVTVLFLAFGEGGGSEGQASPLYAPVAEKATSWLADAGAWLQPYLASNAIGLTIAVVVLFVVVGIVDKIVLMRLWRR